MVRARIRKFKPAGIAASAAIGALLFAACGNAPAGAVDSANDDDAPFRWTPGPLDEFSMRIGGWSMNNNETQAEIQARMDEEARVEQEAIAACMAGLGFTYHPMPNSGGTVIVHDEGDGPQMGTLAFAETYGFAIAINPWSEMSEQRQEEPIEWYDPNEAVRAEMSDAEQEAWWEALWGGPQEDGEWDPMLAGCAGQAMAARWETSGEDEAFTHLQEEINRMWDDLQADPRLLALHASWGACMADAGHSGFDSLNTLQNGLFEEWSTIQGWNNPAFETWDWELNPDGPPMVEPDPAAVAAFAEREIALAVANFHCNAALNLEAETQAIAHDLQQQFVDRHRAELEAWAQAAEARRNG